MSATELKASIDLGTNTCLLLLANCDVVSGEVLDVLSDHSTVVRLGQGVDRARTLHPEAMARTLECLRRYSDEVRAAGLLPSQVIAVATSQARDARNGREFFDQVEKETGIKFRVISGDEEARASFLGGLLPGMTPLSTCIIDIGGGSTELVSAQGGTSIDIGSVRFTERFLKTDPVTDEEFWACEEAIDRELESLIPWRKTLPQGAQLVGVAGTATTLAAWQLGLPHFVASRIDGLELSRGDLHRMVEELKWRTAEERRQLPGVEPLRADVLLAGALILWRATEVLGFSSVTISTRGLRFGILQTHKLA
jgi:exopolyphosphatase/guanosine-5'-triphosphate,3'-diphosphate pyrophosphatase